MVKLHLLQTISMPLLGNRVSFACRMSLCPEREAGLGRGRRGTAVTTKDSANPREPWGWKDLEELSCPEARRLGLYIPPLTSHWKWASPESGGDLGQEDSLQQRAILERDSS